MNHGHGFLDPLPALLLAFVTACGTGADGPPAPADAGPREGRAAAVPEGRPPADPIFVESAAEAGLDFVHHNGMSGELYLAEITCGGGALVDFDNDGDLDAYLLQGRMLGPGKTIADASIAPAYPLPLSDRLYRNELAAEGGVVSFLDVTAAIGAETTGYGCGVAVGDVDNDGWDDLYVANLGPNQLLRNLGTGSSGAVFEDVTAGAGVGDAGSGVAAAFFDFDRDGWLDLFVGNNVTFDYSGETVCQSLSGARDYCGPGAYPAEGDRLFRNRGGERSGAPAFEDVTVRSGLAAAPARPTLGAVAADFDGDGWQDLYVANDGEPNNLWVNRRDGTFVDDALLMGCALNAAGAAEASMGVDAGDFDGDGDLDLFLTHLVKESNTLYRNDGRGSFEDVTAAAGLAAPSLPYTSFGTGFLDVDNDGWLDLLVVSGAVTLIPELAARGDPFPLHQRNQLFRNLGGGPGAVRFVDLTADAGEVFALSEVSRGAAFGDVDNDGDVDVLVLNNAGPARLLVNEVGNRRPWLGVRLVPGARAALLRAGRASTWRLAATGGSYSSASDPRVLFGLGDDGAVDGVRVAWPDGSVEDFAGVAAGQYQTLRRGDGAVVEESP